MATSKLELAVGTGQWDAGLKKAQQALNSFTQSQGGLQQALGKDNEKMVQFVQMMGKIDSTANTAKGQLRDYRNSIEQLSAAFNSLSDAQKKGVEGQTITSALDSLKAKAMNAKQEVERLNVELGGVGKTSGTFNQLFSGVAGKFGMSPQMFTGVGAAIAGVGVAAKLAGDNIRTAFNFERSISGLSALTGMTGKDLEKLKNNAIELGSTTTLTASQVADAFRLIGSQQPQLLSDADALKEVTKYAIRLSEAAGIELATASQTLSTSINQMGGDSANAARYVNVLAAASQKGAGDISWLGEAITKAATAAKAVGTDYEELVANLEQLAKAGFDASTAGTALRSIIMNLEKQANSQFKPSVVGLTQAFENLGKAQLDITGYQNIAGKMFATQAKVLAEAAGAAKEMQEAITGTNIAEEQAQTNTANLDGSLKALASAWEGLNLHINDSNGFLKSCVDWLKETVQWMDNTFTAAGRAKKALDDLRGGGENGKGRKIDTRTEYEVKEVKSAMQGEGDAAKVKQQQILDKYDRDIAAKEKELANLQKIATTNPGNYLDLLDRVRNEVEALKTLKQEFKSASDALITPKQAPQKTEIINTEEVEESRRSISTTNKNSATTKELNPMQQAQKEISALTEEALTADEGRLDVIKKEIAALNEQLKVYKEIQDYVVGKEPDWSKLVVVGDRKAFEAEQMRKFEVELGISKNAFTEKNVSSFISDLKNQIQTADLGSELYNNLTKQLADANALSNLMQTAIKNGIDISKFNPQDLWSKVFGQNPGDYISDEQLEEIRKKIEEAIGKPIKLDVNTGNINGEGSGGSSSKETGSKYLSQISGGISSMTSSIEQLGIQVPEGLKAVVGGIQAVTSILTTISTIMSAIEAFSAAGSIPFFSNGGIIPHAANGYFVPGTHYSGDTTPIMANAGELVLSRAQQSNLASTLSRRDESEYGGTPYVSGEQIFLGLNNYLKRSGRGELLTARS